MSVEDLEKNRYGLEIARLDVAQAAAKKALSFAKPGIVSDAVIADIKVRNGIPSALKSWTDARAARLAGSVGGGRGLAHARKARQRPHLPRARAAADRAGVDPGRAHGQGRRAVRGRRQPRLAHEGGRRARVGRPRRLRRPPGHQCVDSSALPPLTHTHNRLTRRRSQVSTTTGRTALCGTRSRRLRRTPTSSRPRASFDSLPVPQIADGHKRSLLSSAGRFNPSTCPARCRPSSGPSACRRPFSASPRTSGASAAPSACAS